MMRRHTLAAVLAVAILSPAAEQAQGGQFDGSQLPLVPTTTTLAVTPGPSVFGQPVIATATVAPAAAPGKVTFYDGTTVLGTRPLANGQASFTTSLLAAGTRRLRAIYIAEGRYYRSQSAAVTHVVDAAPQDEFRQPVQFDLQANPHSIAVGDFNLNGRADLVALDQQGSATLMVGTGTGSFSPILAYPAGLTKCGVAVADIDGDSFQDWVICAFPHRRGQRDARPHRHVSSRPSAMAWATLRVMSPRGTSTTTAGSIWPPQTGWAIRSASCSEGPAARSSRRWSFPPVSRRPD